MAEDVKVVMVAPNIRWGEEHAKALGILTKDIYSCKYPKSLRGLDPDVVIILDRDAWGRISEETSATIGMFQAKGAKVIHVYTGRTHLVV